MEFHEKLMELRKEKGWSQEELGNRLNVTRQTISKWELAQTTPEMDKLLELSRLFEISLDELLNNPLFADRAQDSTAAGETAFRYGPCQPCLDKRGYEYKSKKTLWGVPLVHINLMRGGICTARGIIAVGDIGIGVVAVGGLSIGLVAVGGFGIGLLALAGIAAGFLAVGGIAAGVIAIGGVAFGTYALGASAIGSYAVGAAAKGDRVAMGMAARGTIAIGEEVKGAVTFSTDHPIDPLELERVILERFPQTSRIFLEILKKWVAR